MVVTVDDGAPRTFPYAWLQNHQDVSGRYVVREDDGEETSDDRTGTSLRSLATEMGLDPANVTFTEVFDAKGAFHPLDASELGPGGFENGLVPLVYDSGESLTYLRPLRSGDADDANNSTDPNKQGFIRTFDGGSLEITFHTSGRLLHPAIHADRTSVDRDGVVNFSADGVPGLAGPVAYDWTFGGVFEHTVGPTTSHDEWCGSGAVSTSVSVTDASDGSKGRSDSLLITVTGDTSCSNASPGPSSTSTPTPNPTPTPTPTKKPTATPSGSATPTADPTGTSSPNASASAGPSSAPTVAPGPTSSAKPAPVQSSSDNEITGMLLLAANQVPQPVAPAAADSEVAVTTEPATADTRDRLTLPRWLVGVGLLVAIAAFGAIGELRPRWWRQPRMTDRMRP